MKKNDVEDYPIVLTAQDISQILKISKLTAYEVMKIQNFLSLNIRRCKRVLRDEFFEWLKTNGKV
ncbi:DNA-binding protein [Bacillus sp. Bva_UNVM-123]|uniref:DNA-binding protein n=1 Tax=Bacillus sp. Bva_UNVM-123 TaxID=2829798 RepID=UPI00391EE82F